jgi:hypothetical protein
MKRIYSSVYLIAAIFTFHISVAQITINRNDMPGLGDTLRITNTNASAINLLQTGPDYTWDFSSLSGGAQEILDYKNILQTPYFLFFPNIFTFGIKTPDIGFGPFSFTDMYNFFLIDNNQFSYSGIGLKFQGNPFGASYSKNDRIYNFPLRYNDVDSNTFSFTVDLPGIGKYKSSGYRKTTVDGWGEITTPYGTFNCLRLNAYINSIDSITVSVFGFNYSFGIPSEKREYQWLAKGLKAPVLSVEGRILFGNFTITKAYFRGIPINIPTNTPSRNTTASWNAFPNPGKQGWNFDLDPSWSGGKFILFDMQGRQLKEITISGTRMVIDIQGAQTGIYLATLEKGSRRETMKLMLGQ